MSSRVWLLAALLLASPAAAQPDAEQVTLKLERYQALLAQAQRHGAARAAWADGQVRVALPGDDDRFATVSVDARLTVLGEGTAEVALVPPDAVLQAATIDGNAAALVPSAGMQAALIEPGTVSVSLRYLVPIADVDGRQALVPLPPLPGAQLTVEGAPDAEVAPAAAVQRSGGTLTARLPATSAVAVRWGGARRGHAVRRVDYVLTVDESGEGMDVAATVEADLGVERADVRLAQESVALIDVREGATPLTPRVVDGWHVAGVRGKGRKVLTVRFRVAIDRGQGQPQIVLHPDRAPIARVDLTVPGARTVQIDPQVPLTVRVNGQGDRGNTRAVAHLPPVEAVTIRWTESRAAPEQLVRANTETVQLVTLQEGVVRSRALVRYEVIRGKVRELAVRLPDDVVLYKVVGDAVDDWRTFAPQENEPRQVRISLARELEGHFAVELQLEAVAPREEGAPVTLPVVRPLGAFREGGVVALFDGDKVGFGEAQAEGYTKVGQDALPPDVRQTLTDKVSQAFKHIGEPGPIAAKVATAKAREVRFDAHVDTLYLVRDGAMAGHASVLVEIKSGRRDALRLTLPEGVAEPRITAPSLNKVEAVASEEPGRKAYDVRFTQALEGAVQLDVEFEELLPKDLGRVRVPDLRILGAEVEDGNLGITAETGIEVQTAEVKDLRLQTAEELPKAVRLRTEREVLLGFGYTHAPWTLDLDVKRHRTVETLQAVITGAWLETNVLDSGHVVNRATFAVSNEERQYLQLAIPEGSRVLAVAAGGVQVKAVADDQGAIKVPLPRGRRLMIDVVYELTHERMGMLGGMELMFPRPDVRLSDLQWLLRFPSRFTLYGVDTELKERPYYHYRPVPPGSAELPFGVPPGEELTEHLFTYAVLDPTEPAPLLDLTYAGGAAGALDGVVLVLAVGLLGLFVWRRARGAPLDRAGGLLLAGGLSLLVLKAAAWALTGPEALAVAAALLVIGFAARRRARANAPGVP